MNHELADKINLMTTRDQEMRKNARAGGKWDFEIDKENTEELKKIVSKYGWPTIDMVGEQASHHAWLLAQHADHDHEFQKEILETLNKIYSTNPKSIKRSEIAYLTDRILVAENKEQEFGTQLRNAGNNTYELFPVRDPENLNSRRNEYGMEPIEEYLENFI